MLPFVLVLIGTVGLTMVWYLVVRPRGGRVRRVVRGLVASLATYGVVATLSQVLVVPWGKSLVAPDVEWPVGYARGAVRDSQGRYVVPHRPTGRVQVYDADLKFRRGWFIEDDAGEWKVRVADGDRVEVFTSRDRRRLLYDPDGTLLEQETFQPWDYNDIATGPQLAVDPGTPWVLRPFAHPLYGIGMLFLGAIARLAFDRVGIRTGRLAARRQIEEANVGHRRMWRLLGLIAGACLGIVLVIGGMHGASAESSEERRAEQFFFGIPLFDVRGPYEEVRAVERRWERRLYPAGAIVGGALGFCGALWLTRRRG